MIVTKQFNDNGVISYQLFINEMPVSKRWYTVGF